MLNITDVCNMALAHIAKGRISNIDEQSELARQCKLFYEPTRKELLRSYTWGFAKRVSKNLRTGPTFTPTPKSALLCARYLTLTPAQ